MTWFSLLLQNRKALFRSFISDLHDVQTDRFLDIFRDLYPPVVEAICSCLANYMFDYEIEELGN